MNKLDLLKKMLPGLLPLFVFIIADEIWGTKIGLIVAIAFGLAELVYTYIKEKRIDSFILLDTGLIVVLGLISILLENDIFFKLKPALIELIFCIILALSAFSKTNIMLLMSKRYMKGIEINEQQVKMMNRSTRILFFLFLAHTILVVYSAFYMSKEAWGFISGGLFYIMFGIYFVFELINNRIRLLKYKGKEWVPLVDDEGKVIGKAPRALCHKGKGMLHPVVHLHVINNNNQIYLQKRPLYKKIEPGKWDTAVGGHVSINESIDIALIRESFEEIGIKDFKPQLLARYKWETERESELIFMFVTIYNQKLEFNPNELADGKFWTIKQIKENIGKDVFTPNFELEFDILLKNFLRNT